MINTVDIINQILDMVYLNQMFIDNNFVETLEAKHNYLLYSVDTKPIYRFSKLINDLEDSYNLMKTEFLTEVAEFDFDSVQDYIYQLLNLLEELFA